MAIVYFGFVATERYVSEAKFVVRTASRPAASIGLGALLQATGLARSQDDVFSVQAFITSRAAAKELRSRLPVDAIFGPPAADPIARYPSVLFGPTLEQFQNYLQWMISTSHNGTTGITTLRVQAFAPEDAKAIALTLLALGEQTVNDLNTRIRQDALRLAELDVARGEARLIEAQLAITRFRNKETMIDPAGSSLQLTALIARLSAELSRTEAQIIEISSSASTNPQLPSLRRRAEAQREQIMRERERIGSGNGDLAEKLAVYERLELNREFAKEALTTAVRALDAAKHEARRQQLYLERIVDPIAADEATAPERLRHVTAAVGINLVALLVFWLVYSGFKEHATENDA